MSDERNYHEPGFTGPHTTEAFGLHYIMEQTSQEPLMIIKCSSCGIHYSLHNHTVCPKCFTWPT